MNMASAVVNTARRVATRVTQRLNDSRPSQSIQLNNLPKTATCADIRRMCMTMKVENITNVTIDYEHCIPSGRAFLTTANPDATRTAVRSLKNAVIGGHLIIPRPVPDIQHERGRGSRGRIEAGERGIINGSGPNAGLASSDEGRTVVIAGLPANISPDRLRLYFKSFNIATSEKGQLDIIRVEPWSKITASRFMVRAKTRAEAHRIVRRLHMTYYNPDSRGGQFPIRARILH